ncbi:MAG: serine/threonine protein kinase [Sandaracinaceae bacterium]
MSRVLCDRYELSHEVGEGPLAKIWRAHLRGDAGFTRPLAVRELHPRYAKDPRFVGRWASVACELATASVPHVASIHDVVVDRERVYLVAEWIEGVSLARWRRADGDVPVPWGAALRIGLDLLEALAVSHAMEPARVHGGLTLGAVRLERHGAVRLMRFGASEALGLGGAGRREMEELGLLHPTPETANGGAATAFGDLFGVGSLLFELLGGQAPFGDEHALERGEPRDLSELRPDVPPLLVATLERALRADPEDRFESARAMARALETLARTAEVPVDRAALAEVASAAEATVPKAAVPAGPAALAATVRKIASGEHVVPPSLLELPPSKRAEPEPSSDETKLPVGLPTNRTMAVSVSELKEIRVGESTSSQDEEDAEAERKRYSFPKKERSATRRVEQQRAAQLGLRKSDSDAEPLPLTKSKGPGPGLTPVKTEFLDSDELDKLTIGKAPLGLSPAKTEFLDESEVDRLTLSNVAAKHPRKRDEDEE